jgi:predicted neuraminidase
MHWKLTMFMALLLSIPLCADDSVSSESVDTDDETTASIDCNKKPSIEKQFIFPEMLGLKHHSPTITELADGSLLAAWYYGNTYHGEADRGGAILGSSYAKGRWSKPFVLFDAYRKADCNPVIFFNPETERLYLFVGVMQSTENDWSTLTTLWLSADVSEAADIAFEKFEPIKWASVSELRTTDIEGKEPYWSEPGNLLKSTDFAFKGMVLRNKPLIVGDKMFLPFASHIKRLCLFKTWAVVNSDIFIMSMDLKKEMWDKTIYVPANGHAEQPVIAQLNGGSFLLIARNTDSEHNSAWRSQSKDGKTWTSLEKMYSLTNENNSMDMVTLPDGRLLLVHNPYKDRYELSLKISINNGGSWSFESILDFVPGGEVSYPCMILSRDKKILHIVYSYNRRTIAHAIIPVDTLSK